MAKQKFLSSFVKEQPGIPFSPCQHTDSPWWAQPLWDPTSGTDLVTVLVTTPGQLVTALQPQKGTVFGDKLTFFVTQPFSVESRVSCGVTQRAFPTRSFLHKMGTSRKFNVQASVPLKPLWICRNGSGKFINMCPQEGTSTHFPSSSLEPLVTQKWQGKGLCCPV